MSDPFVGEIRMFAGNFPPRGWAFCDGQLLSVSGNDALFSLFGTIYGGDGRTTFGLPDLRGRVPIHAGQGPGLSDRRLGSKGGAEIHTLTVNEMPQHDHELRGTSSGANTGWPADALLAQSQADVYLDNTSGGIANLDGSSVSNAGGSSQHANVMPFQCVHFIVALFGVYPSRT